MKFRGKFSEFRRTKNKFRGKKSAKNRTFSDEKKGRMNGFVINTCKHEGHATKVVSLCDSPTLWESSPFQKGFWRSKNRVKWRDGKYKQWLNPNRALVRYHLHIHGTTRLTLTEHPVATHRTTHLEIPTSPQQQRTAAESRPQCAVWHCTLSEEK